MPFNGSGSFTRVMDWQSDAAAEIKIQADRHDQNDDDLANGLSNCLTRDGQSLPTGNIPLGGFKLTGLADPEQPQEAATKSYVDKVRAFETSIDISGSDANGRIRFTGATGANGISWTATDLSWLARLSSGAEGLRHRIALNNKADGSGSDVLSIDRDGRIATGGAHIVLGANAFLDSSGGNWRAVVAGWTPVMTLDPNDGAYRFHASGASIAAGAVAALNTNVTFDNGGNIWARSHVHAGHNLYAGNGSAAYQNDGNVIGPIWNHWGAADAFSAINIRIENRAAAWADQRGRDWANDRIAQLQYRRVSRGHIQIWSYAEEINVPAGAVMTGIRSAGSWRVDFVFFHYLQVFDPVRGWVGFSG